MAMDTHPKLKQIVLVTTQSDQNTGDLGKADQFFFFFNERRTEAFRELRKAITSPRCSGLMEVSK